MSQRIVSRFWLYMYDISLKNLLSSSYINYYEVHLFLLSFDYFLSIRHVCNVVHTVVGRRLTFLFIESHFTCLHRSSAYRTYRCRCNIRKTLLPYTPLLYSKTVVYRGIPIFLIFAPKHRLWVLVRTASPRRF